MIDRAVSRWSEVRSAFRLHPRDAAIAALAIPALGTLAIDPVVSIVDTAWVGRLGASELAALAVASAVFATVFSVFNFVHVAITPLVAGEVGGGDLQRAGAVTKGAVAVGLALGCGVGVVAIALAGPVVELFGASDDVAALAVPYLRIRFLSLPGLLVAMVGHGVYRGHQDTRTPLYVAIGMNAINLILDPILIFGLDLGVEGAAWATVAAQTLSACMFLTLIFVKDAHRLGVRGPIGRITSLGIPKILAAGWPMVLRSTALLVAISASTMAATRVSTDAGAAHQIVLQVFLFMAFVLDAYAIAAMALVGTDLGSGARDVARSTANRLLALGLMTGVLLAIVLIPLGPHLGDLFGVDDNVEELARSIFIIVVVVQPFTALVYVWDGVAVGASAFRFMAASTSAAAVLCIAWLALFGDTLLGVWGGLVVLTLGRMVPFMGWHAWGPIAFGRGPSPESREAESRGTLR